MIIVELKIKKINEIMNPLVKNFVLPEALDILKSINFLMLLKFL